MTEIHQFLSTFAGRDAIGAHTLRLRRLLREAGFRSDIYAVDTHDDVRTEALDAAAFTRRTGETSDPWILYHFSIGHPLFDRVRGLDAQLALDYHNVTDAKYFWRWEPRAATTMLEGRRQLAVAAPAVRFGVADSEFNQRELDAAGYARTAHVPILIDWHAYDRAPDDAIMARWDGVQPLLLFVGRVSPHKRQDDLIRMLAYYRACIDPNARLVLVGGYRDQPQYHARLAELVKALHLEPSVTFAGAVSTAELVAYFRSASAFVSLSEHEGFGVPLLEAMKFDVPVIARDAAAVGETVDGAGILLKDRDLAQAAEAVGLVLERPELRERLVAAGRERLRAFDPDRVALQTREALGL